MLLTSPRHALTARVRDSDIKRLHLTRVHTVSSFFLLFNPLARKTFANENLTKVASIFNLEMESSREINSRYKTYIKNKESCVGSNFLPLSFNFRKWLTLQTKNIALGGRVRGKVFAK